MELLGSTITKITKDKNGENVPHLEITEIVSSIQNEGIETFCPLGNILV